MKHAQYRLFHLRNCMARLFWYIRLFLRNLSLVHWTYFHDLYIHTNAFYWLSYALTQNIIPKVYINKTAPNKLALPTMWHHITEEHNPACFNWTRDEICVRIHTCKISHGQYATHIKRTWELWCSRRFAFVTFCYPFFTYLCICEDISIPCVLLPLFYLIGTQFIFRQGIQRVCIEFVHISRMSIPLTESIF